jgi:hypothetical protein
MAAAKPNWPDSSVFLMGRAQFGDQNHLKQHGISIPNRSMAEPIGPAQGNASFYILLCMFNGFAIARPFCQAIKVSLTGVEF